MSENWTIYMEDVFVFQFQLIRGIIASLHLVNHFQFQEISQTRITSSRVNRMFSWVLEWRVKILQKKYR